MLILKKISKKISKKMLKKIDDQINFYNFNEIIIVIIHVSLRFPHVECAIFLEFDLSLFKSKHKIEFVFIYIELHIECDEEDVYEYTFSFVFHIDERQLASKCIKLVVNDEIN